ncbi:CLPTM1-like membrane protein cnrB [Babesia microti strain RI]|uniref:CLPTM1-like membrane protein cnrB n=1 Tax=Babesia microti (strain RI) TaxID=1133968 RepID=A0A1R4AB71_BABMR|nr:CLPTM1-like membrane protein cnrB [Babesia microti strain RI]SJK86210.1 CLPTM1-like membrane protein cnrB [Babesia microti strain RI]|eukprot:XP_021338398.1 CLPTM1-like membrane protein cnrB [Babesia microti strain RI]
MTDMTSEDTRPYWHPSRWMSNVFVQIVMFQLTMKFILNRTVYMESQSESKIANLTNFFKPRTAFDLYGYISPFDTKDINILDTHGTLVYSLENQIYSHKYGQSYEKIETLFVPAEYTRELDFNPFFVVVMIPHFSYMQKHNNPAKSIFVEGKEGRYIAKSIPLTVSGDFVKHLKVEEPQKKLLLDANDSVGDSLKPEPIKYWVPRVDINLVYETNIYRPSTFNYALQGYSVDLEQGVYDPRLSLSRFWNLADNYIPVDGEKMGLGFQLTINFAHCTTFYGIAIDQFGAVQHMSAQNGTVGVKETEMLKKILLTTNFYMLVFSILFIFTHTIFSFFALKNDMQFWYNNESMEGLSAMSLWFNFACEIIIGLYVLDSEETSRLVLFEIFLGIAASFWKVTKSLKITYLEQYPYIKVTSALSYKESKTEEYDRIAIKYMSMALAPCVAGYAIYSLLYNTHKSWYSYFIQVAAGSVYTFGFIMLTPQLYINYKLKSVDHLPWRALIYKSLNTFVDDVASFLIDMPWMHRLSCFRDDIIFIIYLYQRWIYKTDKTRSGKVD